MLGNGEIPRPCCSQMTHLNSKTPHFIPNIKHPLTDTMKIFPQTSVIPPPGVTFYPYTLFVTFSHQVSLISHIMIWLVAWLPGCMVAWLHFFYSVGPLSRLLVFM